VADPPDFAGMSRVDVRRLIEEKLCSVMERRHLEDWWWD
jgi:hypothetical protein